MISISIILLILLAIVSIIDLKFKSIPSTFLTGIVFLTAIVHFYNFEVGLISLAFGTLAFLYAWTLYEANFIGGIADVKVLVIIGLMIQSVLYFFAFMLLVVLLGMGYKLFFRYVLRKEDKEEVPFLLGLYAVYLTLFFIGGVA